MLMIDKNSEEFFNKVKVWAELTGRWPQLKEQLDYLANYAVGKGDPKDKTICLLYKDGFSDTPNFGFTMYVQRSTSTGVVLNGDTYPDHVYWFNGGLLHHGPHDGFGSGSGPTFAVTLTPTDGWSIHT